MGLGKTVQMIACLTINQPSPDDASQSTLVVVPAALLLQWKQEIEEKTNGAFSVHIHHGKDKLKSLSRMKEFDVSLSFHSRCAHICVYLGMYADIYVMRQVIITTYGTLNSDFGVPADIEEDDRAKWLADSGGLTARMKWHRAILDEAQFVRNRSTRSSRSVAHIRSRYRWMLSGTPVTNTLADIYGLLRFGRFRPWNDWDHFNEYVAKVQNEDAPLAGARAREILKPLILRRTKGSMLEGRPILELPPKEVEMVTLEFSQEERDIYDSFEKQSQIQVNRFIRNNTLVKNNAAVLVSSSHILTSCPS
jgi:SNF2 family DNA or RNA helicase